MSITKETIGKELYVWFWERGLKKLLYKRWLDKDYGMVMDRQPFTAKDTESFNQSIKWDKFVVLKGKKGNIFWTTNDGSDYAELGYTILDCCSTVEEATKSWEYFTYKRNIS